MDQSLHGRLIGAKGVLKKMMELESGAHIVYRVEPEPCCQIYGNQGARERAWQLVSGKIWDLQHASEEYYPLDKRFHGTLIGKGSVVVRALEEQTVITPPPSPRHPPPRACAWAPTPTTVYDASPLSGMAIDPPGER